MSFSWLVMTFNAGAGVPLPETSANQVVTAPGSSPRSEDRGHDETIDRKPSTISSMIIALFRALSDDTPNEGQ
jgi:hypothetical protein